jgi:hypothetical protein
LASLSKHLREAGSHGHLPFHPDCALCARERLNGTLAGDVLLGTRTQAGLLAATLAVSGLAAPGVAVAGDEPISAQAPRDGELDSGLAEPDAAPDSEDAQPIGDNLLTPDPDDGRDAPEETPLTELTTPVEEPEAEPAEPEVIPVAPAPPSPVAAPPVEAPPPPVLPAVPKAKPSVLVDLGGSTRARVQTLRLEVTEVNNTRSARGPTSPPVAEPTVSPVTATAAAAPAETHSAAGKRVAGETYKVQRGDSLWSIAQRRLGQATTGQVAREVHRLWELNKERIATGDPDLLVVGTVLRLP